MNDDKSTNNSGPKQSSSPSFCLVNACSLLLKLDELGALLATNVVDFVAITETWLNGDFEDHLLSICGYNIFWRDRVHSRGGGVCGYLAQNIPCRHLLDLENPNFECLWVWLRPNRLPRPLSGIVVCMVYHPPGLPAEDHRSLNEYVINTIDFLRNKYPDYGVVVLGDFNDFDISQLLSTHNLKQVVQLPTRGSAILDLIVTNLRNKYMSPRILAPLGWSVHTIVQWLPSLGNVTHAKPTKRLVRRYPQSGIDVFGGWVTAHDWYSELGSTPTAADFTAAFTSQLTGAVDRIFPLKTFKCNHSDKPWITSAIKLLIKDRQKAFHSLNLPLWPLLRHKVQQEITVRKKAYYKIKVQHLRKDDCRRWWGAVNRLTIRSEKASSYSLECDGKVLNEMELAVTLNQFHVSINEDIPPLDATTIPAFLPAETCVQLSNLMKFAGSSWQFSLSKPRDLTMCHVVFWKNSPMN